MKDFFFKAPGRAQGMKALIVGLGVLGAVSAVAVAEPKRARDWGIPFDGKPGALNAITDVKGIEVGMTTINGERKGKEKDAPKIYIHTGVTAIFPLGKESDSGVPAGWYSLNGNGEMTGTTWVEESGFLEGPVLFTNTHSVGTVRDSVIEWGVKKFKGSEMFSLPVVGETWDGVLNDINGFHVHKKHVLDALERAKSGPVPEGSVGGGTGMIVYEYKGGTGTSSRLVGDYTIGAIVQANYGNREDLRIAGLPIGQSLLEDHRLNKKKDGSILVVIATDAPLLPHQLKRLARRVPLALGRLGSISRDTSGDIFLAFSTQRPVRNGDIHEWKSLVNAKLDGLFEGAIQATEEAIVNVLVAGRNMQGPNISVYPMPIEKVVRLLRKNGRIQKQEAR